MGVVNVTPDSFSDGGSLFASQSLCLDAAMVRARAMVAQGASFLDIGGESTRPGAEPVSAQQELDRVIPVIEAIKASLDVVVSIDTSTPQVMLEAAAAGAGLINDVRALGRDGALCAVASTALPVCLMHMQGDPKTMQDNPGYESVVQDIGDYFEQRISECERAGIAAHNILLDPGFGFGKSLAHNLQLLKQLQTLANKGLPLLVGMSRKSMIGNVLNRPVDERLHGGLAVAVMAYERGAHIVRVHDVGPTVDALRMAHAVINSI
ncbi:MAG: dihydropteroate synthase [Oceanospirillaceae bacterium]|nr:dihydropteroate synthase [Oceanospirillaceae bacterium]MBT4443967.1 dihydropteroate synthase [Oceanospirillaceae bacterium]MBT6077552.1 dihydropteroate synthase [Oceanospirillaceae bacterium]MBT7329996.1 dihydropteroate synthase [Oceanospirillaceae bacterium]